jgi:POT family proton-dependent oligopeptide transporter
MEKSSSVKTFLGHPIGLFVLFFTEMWERFSYYGMRGLLKLYLVNYLFITIRQMVQGGPYTGIGNPNEVIGWNFIQKLLGAIDPAKLQQCITEKVASLIKGDVANNIAPMAAGLAKQVAEQTCTATPHASVLYGWYTGLVYLTPVLGGYLADRFLGQKRAVLIGGTLMALGQFVLFGVESLFFIALLLIILGNGFFKPNISTQVGSLYPEGDPRRDGAFTIFYMGINLGAFICNLICGTLAAIYGWRWGFFAAGVGMCIGLTVQIFGRRYLPLDTLQKKKEASTTQIREPLTRDEWRRVGALVLLCLLNVVFWAVYEQQGNTMQTWADEQTQWPMIFGFQVPSTWFQSVNPLFIIVLALIIPLFWAWQAKRNKEPSSVAKMAIGAILLGLSFIIMIVGAHLIGSGKGSWLWPVSATMVLTLGEMYLSPIGLSLVTKVAPVRIVSMMMGVWFLSSFLGNILSGYIGQLYTFLSKETFFFLLLCLGVGTGLAIWAFSKPLKKAMSGSK